MQTITTKQKDVMSCDGCNRLHPTQTSLKGQLPSTFILQLAWETPAAGIQEILATTRALQEVHSNHLFTFY